MKTQIPFLKTVSKPKKTLPKAGFPGVEMGRKKWNLSFLAAAVVLLCSIIMPSVYALDDSTLDMFDQNGIYYYNPSGNNGCVSISTTLRGKDIIEKTWNFFIDQGFNDAQVSGILGNAKAESGFSPTRSLKGTYWGIFQWGGGRQAALFEKLRAAGLGAYLDSAYWPAGADKNIPAADLDAILQISLEHAMSEPDYDWQNELKKAHTPAEAAEIFLVLFERAIASPKHPGSEILYYAPFAGLEYQGAAGRRDNAAAFFKQYSGNGISNFSNPTATDGANVTIIGDSIAAGATTALLVKFPELATHNISVAVSRTWAEGIEIAKAIPLQDIVVFALGTNTPNLAQADIDSAMSAIGNGRRVVFVTNYGPAGYTSNNALFRQATVNYRNVIIADWATTVSKAPQTYLQNDQVHPNSAGNNLFAETIFKAINSNTNANGCSVTGEFIALVRAYAWPDFHPPQFVDRMPAYANAVTISISEGRYVGGSVAGVPGIDCGGFVTVLVQNSGLAPEYNGYNSNTGPQEKWVVDNGWLLVNGSPTTPVDTSLLQPGDVAFSGGTGYQNNGHTFIYVGEIPGFNSVIASASYSTTGESGRAPMAGREDLIGSAGSPVRWYRKN
ncbi:phage tail tip lysozyme [Candidatus Saccharibacteria bacterium]|nr:phage tail tip lysozyme [Candidatus Saccharibacteria bacterium]